jgi:tetratricopeptide (TPR) repeat protein
LGLIKASLGEWEEAESLLKQNLQEASNVDINVDIKVRAQYLGVAHNALTWLYLRQGRLYEAEEHCMESLRLRRETSQDEHEANRGVGYCYGYLGEIYVEQKYWSVAEAFISGAIEHFSGIRDLRNVAEQYYMLARITLERDHDTETALRHANRCLEYFANPNFILGQAQAKRLKGMVYAQYRGFDNEAQELLKSH